MLNSIAKWFAETTFRMNRAEFYDDLADAIKARQSFDFFLKMCTDYATKLKLNWAPMFPVIRRRFESTGSLSGALGPLVPATDRMVIVAAEKSGNVEDGLKFLVRSLGYAKEMRGAIISAMITPIFLFLFLGGMLAGIAMYGIPAMTELLPADKWTGEGRNLLVLSKFIRSYGLAIVITLVAGAYFFTGSLTKWFGPQRAKFDRKLPYSFFAAYQGAMLLVSLTALNRGGMSVVASLKQLLEASTPWMGWHLRKIIKNIETAPDKFAEAFDTGMYSDRIIFRMALAASTGNIETKLEEIAMVAMTETIKRIKMSSGFINKIMMAIFGMLLMYVFGTFMLTAQGVGMQAGRSG